MPSAKILKLDVKKKMSEERLNYLNLYVEYGGDNKKAWIDAGLSETTIGRSMAIVREEWDTVQQLIRMRIDQHVPMALEGIVELAKNAKQDSVRLKALQDLLSRAGYDQAKEFIVSDRPAEDMDKAELEAEILTLLKGSTDG